MKNKIWLSPPHMGGEEIPFINDAFSSNWIAPLGPNVDGFEEDLCSFTGAGHSAALNSGTAAIHLALAALGVGLGDEVLCSTFTFAASANPVIYRNAAPVFVDSERESWNMSPFMLENAIRERIKKGKKPKAVILVHLYGNPSDMDSIMQISRYYKIPVIEDAAEALGSTYKSRHLGTFGTMGTFSFNGNKIITTSGGGALLSDNREYIEKARFLSSQARDNAPHYQHSQVGYNYRMSNVSAGIGRGQMRVLDKRIAQRRANYFYYRHCLSRLPGIGFQEELSGAVSNRWLSCITIDPKESGGITREDLRLALEADNIESRPLWKPMHLQPVFRGFPYYGGGISDNLFEQGLCLPSGSNMTESDLERVTGTIVKCFEKAGTKSFAA
ncbi:MAG TPA: DegT/DnrJ/EryC1/StrS family aminotransferase [Ignavibacteriales bacterium]|nr:DegT/DnrJ/EryC1/StrS family aminotransferase [Ignavibacteriales bacterium]